MKRKDAVPEFLIRRDGDTHEIILAKLIEGMNYFYNRDDFAPGDKSHECRDNHHILISDLAIPQCVLCLTHFTWKAVERELKRQYGPRADSDAVIRVGELKAMATNVKRKKFPGKSFITQRIRCLTGHHFRYIERVFYDID